MPVYLQSGVWVAFGIPFVSPLTTSLLADYTRTSITFTPYVGTHPRANGTTAPMIFMCKIVCTYTLAF